MWFTVGLEAVRAASPVNDEKILRADVLRVKGRLSFYSASRRRNALKGETSSGIGVDSSSTRNPRRLASCVGVQPCWIS